MSFYTALTGLNGSQADIAATSNNIANVGTTGFKRSRAEFGDIFATSPLQNSSSSIGSGSILKGVKQQFTQGNIAASLNALDLAISGQGFFALKPSLTSSQVVYTRNGSFNVDNNRNVVDSTGQFLLTYPVNEDGSVTSKTINDAVPLQLPVTSGEPKATSNIDLSINLPADAPVITDNPKFADGYQFSTSDPESFTNSTSLTIFDDLGNPTIATVYFIKTQASTADDPTNKYDTRLVIDETVINPDLVASVNDNNEQIYSCSRSGGLWKTENEGATWQSSSTETLPASGVNSITVDPSDFNHVYVALQNANNNYSYGIYESLNGGDSFTETGFT